MNTADADVYRFLRFFTFLSEEEIQQIEEDDRNSEISTSSTAYSCRKSDSISTQSSTIEAAQNITRCLFENDLEHLSSLILLN